MDLTFTEEQEELRLSVRRFLAEKSPETEVRRLMETADGYEPAVWRQMADQLGLQGLIVPESFGGAGYTYRELAIVFEEMGRALLCAPYFSTVALATTLLLACGDEAAQSAYLPGIASGSTIATVALTEESGRWDEEGVTLPATRSADGWQLTGEKTYVIDAQAADLILVVARTAAGPSIFAVTKGSPGLTVEPLTTMDQTRKQARVRFDAAPATLLGAEGSGWAGVSAMLDLAAVALAAEQAGGAQQVLDLAVAYAQHRMQFGRTIGSFQAIKHKCANMLLDVESAKAAAYAAAASAASSDDELPRIASMVKTFCSEAYSYTAAEAIQVHGGMGFTWAHPCHLYYRRARSSEIILGDPNYHRELLAQRLGVGF
jgi:alkylation response protein AidB-like acyl-CoA dehydrogenase